MVEHTPIRGELIDGAVALPAARAVGRPGRVATAAWDEDALTLAASACLDVLDRTDVAPAALVAATVSAPLPEPGIAPFLAEVLDLQSSSGRRTFVAEHGGSVAASGAALAHALTLVAAGVSPVLVAAADTRRDADGRAFGDAAGAILVGDTGEGGTIRHVGSDAELFLDRWRTDAGGVTFGDRSLDRFGPDRTVGERFVTEAVVVGPTAPHVERVGHAGCAQLPVVMLTSSGEPGAYAASAGGLTHVFEFTPGPGFSAIATRASAVVDAGSDSSPPPSPDMAEFSPFVSHAINRRERGPTYRLEAVRDLESDEIVYPPPPGPAATSAAPHRLARTGTVHTFARDHVFPVGAPVSMAVVDLDGGGRFYAQVADGREVAIGDRVSLALRRVHTGDGVPHYFWKAVVERKES